MESIHDTQPVPTPASRYLISSNDRAAIIRQKGEIFTVLILDTTIPYNSVDVDYSEFTDTILAEEWAYEQI